MESGSVPKIWLVLYLASLSSVLESFDVLVFLLQSNQSEL